VLSRSCLLTCFEVNTTHHHPTAHYHPSQPSAITNSSYLPHLRFGQFLRLLSPLSSSTPLLPPPPPLLPSPSKGIEGKYICYILAECVYISQWANKLTYKVNKSVTLQMQIFRTHAQEL